LIFSIRIENQLLKKTISVSRRIEKKNQQLMKWRLKKSIIIDFFNLEV